MKTTISKDKDNKYKDSNYTRNGCHWIPPMVDPLSLSDLDVEKWYVSSEVWVYALAALPTIRIENKSLRMYMCQLQISWIGAEQR